jgi:hypothetical protein
MAADSPKLLSAELPFFATEIYEPLLRRLWT